MASATYNSYKEDILRANVDWANDTMKLSLHTSTYTPNIDSHDFWDDATNEVSNSGTYSSGGATLSVTVSQDNTDDEGVADATDVSFTSFSGTARYAVIYKSTGTPGTSNLVLYIDFGSDQTATSGTFTITFASEGILNIG